MAKKKKKDEIVATVGLDGSIVKSNNNKQNKNIVATVGLDGSIAPITREKTNVSNNGATNNQSNFFTRARDNINQSIAQAITQGTFENDFRNTGSLSVNNSKSIAPIANKQEEQYLDTGKKYGDYFYYDYENKKDNKIYKKGNNYYLYDDRTKSYTDINQATNRLSDKKIEKEQLEKAKKLGYKEQERKTTKEYDKANSVFKKLQKQYKLSDKELQNFIDKGTLSQKHVSLVTNSMSNLARQAVEYREDIKKGKIKQYDDTVLSISDRLDLDTKGLTKKQRKEFEQDLLRQQKAKDNQYRGVRYGYDGTLSGTLKALVSTKERVSDKINREIVAPINNIKENYEYGKKNNQLALEYYKKMEGKKNKADKLNKETELYNYFNKDLATNPGWAGTAIQNANTQVESIKKQGIAASILSGVGAVVGTVVEPGAGTVAGAKAGASLGYTLGSTPYTYKLEAGNQYKELLDMGVPDKIAKKHSKRVGAINAAIESGENVVDLLTFNLGGSSKAIPKETVKDLVDEYGDKQVKSWLRKSLGDKVADSMVTAAKSYGQNIVSESIEEMSQEGASIAGERLAANEGGIKRDKTIKDDLKRVLQAGSSAAISTAFTAPVSSLGGAIAHNTVTNLQEGINNKIAPVNNTNDIITQETINNEKYSKQIAPTILQYQETDNQQINNFRQSAVNEGMINSKKTQDLMNLVENVIKDKNYNILFDSTITNTKGESVNGKISLNENGQTDIRLNPNSDRAAEFLLTHEITHAIETKELRGLILNFAKKNTEFQTSLQDLHKIYNPEDVSDEVVADISAQVLGNQEFINSLQDQNTPQSKNVIKNIYESIKRLLNQMTSKGRYRNFVQDLETKWRDAYRVATNETTKNNLINNEKLSIMKNSAGKYVKADRQVITGDNHLEWEKQVENYINNSIREGKDVNIMTDDGEILTITKDTAGKAKFRNQVTNKNGKTRYMTNQEFLSKLNAEIHVDELAQVSKKINKKPIPDYKDHLFAKDGFDYRNAYFEDFDGQYYRITMSVGKNGNINTIYNIGKMSKKNRSQSSLAAQRPSNNKVASDEDVTSIDNNIPQSNKNVKSDISTKYSMQSKGNNTQELDNSSFSIEENNKLRDKAKEEIGTTNNLREAGYLTNDGEYLDFSGKKHGARGGQRQMDHREIADIYSDEEYDAAEKKYSNMGSATAILQDFIDKGNIRLNGTGVEIATAPTEQQYSKLYDYLEHVQQDNGEVFIDLDTETNNKENLEYSGKTSINKMINDIKNHYKTENNIETSTNETSTTDNKGRILTKEQQEHFKDSKVRDEVGKLLRMYHGTPNGDFNVFNEGSYFTPNKHYADNYQDENASILKQNKGTTNKKTYEVYLNIKNPFELTNQKAKDIYINEYIRGGNSEFYDPYTSYNEYIKQFEQNDGIDWLEAENLKEWIQKNHPEYDGLVVQEVPDNLDPEAINLGYIIFDPSQVKNVDNTNPTTNDDIRYSQKSQTWQEHLEKNYKSTGTKTYFDEIRNTTKKQIAPIHKEIKTLSSEIKELKQEINSNKQSDAIKAPIANNYEIEDINHQNTEIPVEYNSSIDDKSLTKLSRNIRKELDLNNNQANELKKVIKEYISDETINKNSLYEDIKNKFGEKSIKTKIQEVQDVKRDIANVKLRVPQEVKNGITDFYDLKQRNFRKVNMGSEGQSIDSFYDDISSRHPEFFDEDILTDTDRLLKIIDVANLDSYYNETFTIPDSKLQEVTDYVYDSMYDYRNSERAKAAEQHIKDMYKVEKARKQPKKEKNTTTYDVPKKLTHKEVKQQLLKDMNITAQDLSIGKDISAMNYQLTDPIRVNEKVFGWKLGKKINEETIEKTKHNNAEKTRWLNSERNDIKSLGIKPRSKESAAVQKYGEKQYVTKNNEIMPYGDHQLASEFPNVKTQEKIKRAAQMIRNKYDSYIDQINNVLTSLGYDEIPKRKDYMRHFQELGDVFSKTGVPFNLNDMKAEDLPTDINGLTEFNKPGKNWFASAQQRYGEKTTYDAITGIDGYLEGAANLIYHTADIQRYRALSGLIRDSFGQQKGFENLEGLTDEQINQRIKDIQNNKFSRYAAWLDEQANILAGKKGALDRGVERALGRRGYTFLNTLKKQVGSNMTGLNVRSALTNFISSTIASSKTNKLAMVKGTASTIKNMFHKDGFIDKSDFLTTRFGSDQLSAKKWQKISNAGQIFMNGSDYFTANQIVRSKYYEGLQKGMSEEEAIHYADDFGARVMGDRSQGMMPEAFNSKTLGMFTQFQLETNNQWQYMVHDSKMDFQRNSEINNGLKAGATMLFQMGQLAALSYLFNEGFQALTGSRAAFDPADIFKKLFGLDDDDKDKSFEQRMKEAGSELFDAIPFASLFGSGGRMPIKEALTPFETTADYITGKKDQYGGDITLGNVGESLATTIPYYLLPTGYSQVKKTKKGLSMFSKDKEIKGSYTKSGNLRFPIADTTSKKIQAGLFGEYASSEARKYFDTGRTAFKDNKQNMYQTLNIPIDEYWTIDKNISEIRSKLKGSKKTTEERQKTYYKYIDSLDVSNIQKSILKKSIYKSYKDDDDEIYEYINKSKMSKKNKKTILKRLGLDDY